MSTDAPRIEEPNLVKLDKTDIGNELIKKLLEQQGS